MEKGVEQLSYTLAEALREEALVSPIIYHTLQSIHSGVNPIEALVGALKALVAVNLRLREEVEKLLVERERPYVVVVKGDQPTG